MDHDAKTVYLYGQSTKIQGVYECTLWTTRTRRELMGNVCAHGELDHHKTVAHTDTHTWMKS